MDGGGRGQATAAAARIVMMCARLRTAGGALLRAP